MVKIKAIALDAMGVMYTEGEDLWKLLVPFLRAKGCTLPDDDIHKHYVSCALGQMTSDNFWRSVGQTSAVEDEYLSQYVINPGLVPFLEQMRSMSIPLFCISNDISAWSLKRRQSFKLEPYFSGWVISADVGSRKPDPEIYQALAKALPCLPRECVLVDDRAKNVEAGRPFGFLPLLFSATPEGEGYPVVNNFRDLKTLALG